ncbi:macro domain-containing protein RSc0334-like isoform X2 [Tubulanus polymorphus]|uniref:macro domain-containing protein RSc0334-like isoform X2 n=1 Tax=Tubulanus polymorphus TaxID=672921 RepID=UPI003DA2C4B7
MDKFLTRNVNSGSSDDEEQPSKRRLTRGTMGEQEKERYMKMTRKEKRQLYKCKSDFVTLEDVITWEEQARQDEIERTEQFSIDDEIISKVSLWKGDITTLEIDAIVNAANKSLLGGGGVDGAIHRAAGPYLKHECAALQGCDTGDAKITLGYNLPAKHVIHTVGPMGENPARLESCYKKCLDLMKENNLRSIAFPCISTGIYGYPNKNAAKVALHTVRYWLDENKNDVDRIIFCLFLPVDVNYYTRYSPFYFPLPRND